MSAPTILNVDVTNAMRAFGYSGIAYRDLPEMDRAQVLDVARALADHRDAAHESAARIGFALARESARVERVRRLIDAWVLRGTAASWNLAAGELLLALDPDR